MAVTNTYTINGESAKAIDLGVAYIDLADEAGVKAGCKEYPIPLLNKITVKSEDGALSKSRTIYAGYKIVNQMLGALSPTGSNYNPNDPSLATIIMNGRFGIFEPAHFISTGRRWGNYDLKPDQIESLLNIGIGIKICVRIGYTKSGGSPSTTYVPIFGGSTRFERVKETEVPHYGKIGGSSLSGSEAVPYDDIANYDKRAWFQASLGKENFDIDLGSNITDPDTTKKITITLMAYIGDSPTANNTFPILPMDSGSNTSIVASFDTYNPTIDIVNKDEIHNKDSYDDGYGSVADYQAGSDDTTLYVTIVDPL